MGRHHVDKEATSPRIMRKLAATSSLAAGAGLGLLAAAEADAAVVPFDPPGAPITIPISGNYHFDIDGDGYNDFAIYDSYNGTFRLSDYFGAFGYLGSNQVMNDGLNAAVVPPGGTVGTDTTGWLNNAYLDNFQGTRGYAGVVFDIPGGSPHFGYLDISMAPNHSSVTLYGGAYESDAFTAIRTPEPGSLLLLASGAAGLAAWRRRRGGAANPAD